MCIRDRKAISAGVDQASPHSAEPATNSATETSHIVLPPKRSVAQPDSGMTTDTASR